MVSFNEGILLPDRRRFCESSHQWTSWECPWCTDLECVRKDLELGLKFQRRSVRGFWTGEGLGVSWLCWGLYIAGRSLKVLVKKQGGVGVKREEERKAQWLNRSWMELEVMTARGLYKVSLLASRIRRMVVARILRHRGHPWYTVSSYLEKYARGQKYHLPFDQEGLEPDFC
jgi:hypothetical protein